MNCISDIVIMAKKKLSASKLLLANGFSDEAYHIGGYCIEFLLKASVCKTLGIEDFFGEKDVWAKKFKYPQAFKNHNLEQLLVLSGIYMEFDKKLSDATFKSHWSKACAWNEQSRYLTGKPSLEVKDFLISIEEISKWIENYL